MKVSARTDSLWNKNYIILFALNAVNNASFYLMFSALLLYTKEALQWDAAMVGFFSGFYAIAALVCRPVAGILADRYGAKLPMLAGNILMILSSLMYALFRSYPAMLAGRVLHGIAFSLTNTAMTSAVAASLPKQRLSEGIGYYGLAMILAQSVAPGVGLQLAGRYSFHTVFYASALIVAAGTVWMLFAVPATPRGTAAWKLRISDLIAKECLGLAAIGATISGTNGIFSTYLVLSASSCGISQMDLSPFYWANGAALILSRIIMGRVSDRKGAYGVLYLSMALCAISAGLMLRSTTLLMFCAVGVLKGFGTGIGIPTLQAACFKRTAPERTGIATSTYYIGADIGNGLAPMIAGECVRSMGSSYDPAYLFNLIMLGAGTAGLTVLSCRKTNKTDD